MAGKARMKARVEMERSGSFPGEAEDNEGAASRNIAVKGQNRFVLNRFVLGDGGGDLIPAGDGHPKKNSEENSGQICCPQHRDGTATLVAGDSSRMRLTGLSTVRQLRPDWRQNERIFRHELRPGARERQGGLEDPFTCPTGRLWRHRDSHPRNLPVSPGSAPFPVRPAFSRAASRCPTICRSG